MCLIAYNISGKYIPRSELEVIYKNNPDGFGLMWPESDGTIKTIRGLFDFNEIFKTLKYFKGYTHAWHFRYRTRGEIALEQCHPFSVFQKNKHGLDVYMMHNGTFNIPKFSKKSDSQIFASLIRGRLAQSSRPLRMLRDSEFKKKIENSIGTKNKVLFMLPDGTATILNENMGTWSNDIWYSNTYSFDPNHRKYSSFYNHNKYWHL